MHTYIINMDEARERWQFVREAYSETGLSFSRVSAVIGRKFPLPHPSYDEARYRLCHGQRTNPGQLGCYMSHLKCLQMFLESGDDFAMIAEDDSKPSADIAEVLEAARKYESCWDILRVCGFHNPHPKPFVNLVGEYKLAICFTRLCGTGAYVVSRHAADVLLQKLVPMFLPIDHALDREWAYGLRAAAVMPLPISQVEHPFSTQIPATKNYKLPAIQRYWSVFPFRIRNEFSRLISRTRQWNRAKKLVSLVSMESRQSQKAEMSERVRVAA